MVPSYHSACSSPCRPPPRNSAAIRRWVEHVCVSVCLYGLGGIKGNLEPRRRISACCTDSEKIPVMTIGILAAVLGLLLAAACIGIPQLVRSRRQQPDDDDALAYEEETRRSARDIAQGNAAVRARQQKDARSQQASGEGGYPAG